MRFRDRHDAGRQLASKLGAYAGRDDVVVLGLPRGGVPVAAEVAAALHAPLDVFLVRKLGVPSHAEFAMGAIAEGGVEVLSRDIVRDLGLSRAQVEEVAARERLELERRARLYRGSHQASDVRDRIVILVDDGLATGATMEAAVRAIRRREPRRIVVAIPVGARESCSRLRRVADEVVVVSTPEPFDAVGLWYESFQQTTDDEVRALLGTGDHLPRASSARPRVTETASIVAERAIPLQGDPNQYDALIEAVGDARFVLLGEATHGTHEFYRERAFITRRLIAEKGFTAVAVEADWPDAYRVNRYVRAVGPDQDAVQALSEFGRFPTWMWRNADVLDFVGWLRSRNETLPAERRAGFYGLDLYSLRASMEAVLAYLDKVDPDAARRARHRYGCFDRFGEELQDYGYAASSGLHPSCEREVLSQLLELHQQRAVYATRDGRIAADDYFFAEQNARLVANAEAYYRAMFHGRDASWNLRDRHMTDTLDALQRYLSTMTPGARVVVWAHNSHLGDARATELGQSGELNVGQLVRERFGTAALLVGFTTCSGTVTAASEWGGPALRKHVRQALPSSYERLFHDAGIVRGLLPLRNDAALASVLSPRLERAIGVLYLPQTERRSHYFHADLPRQFDFVLHFDETRAVEPLEPGALWADGEVVETYPSGL